jgi:hypothetical protein
VICLGMALAAVLLAANIWRTSGRRDASAVIEKGAGRTHFLAMCGLAGGIGFAVSILFDTPGLLVVPLCLN